jgi:hypothetical protein
MGAAAILLWIGSYLLPWRVALLPGGDVALGLASINGATGIVEFWWNGTMSWVLLVSYWHLIAPLVIAFGITYCRREARSDTDASGSFPVITHTEEQNPLGKPSTSEETG